MAGKTGDKALFLGGVLGGATFMLRYGKGSQKQSYNEKQTDLGKTI